MFKGFTRKEKTLYIVAIAGLIFMAAVGFLLWRINQEGSLSSEETDASSKLACGEYGCEEDSDCEGWDDREYSCDQVMSHDASKQRCERISCPTGYEMEDDQCTCTLVDSSCDGGGWTSEPTSVEEGNKVTISGYGEDASGIDSDSITIEIDGAEVNSSSITLSEGTTVTSWSIIASGLSVGSHTVEVSWADTEGNTGNDCELTTTFTVTATEEEEEEEEEAVVEEEEEEETTVSVATTTIPQTGILDEAWGKIALGFAILSVGMIFMKFNLFELDWRGVEINGRAGQFLRKKSKTKMNGFEKKVVKRK